jgi:hypothetical protein
MDQGGVVPPQEDAAASAEMVSLELRRYVAEAAQCPTLLAAQLARVGLAALQARLACDEAAVLRLLLCEAPMVAAWERDVAWIAAYAGLDVQRLDRLLRLLGIGDRTDWSGLLRPA